VERFFDRSDPEKQFLLNIIDSCENPIELKPKKEKGFIAWLKKFLCG
jgi:hypothetical protein